MKLKPNDQIHCWSKFINQSLASEIQNSFGEETELVRAMKYSALFGGKRFRPLLMLAAGQAMNIEKEKLRTFFCAIELIHCYSLVHDDLPAMDDDDFRRGNLTSHKVFGEAMAILAGDALLTFAFQLAAKRTEFLVENQLDASVFLAKCAGGMVAGQALDIRAERTPKNLSSLEKIHSQKTGKLIVAAICVPGILVGCPETEQFSDFAENLGTLYQIQDDLLDVLGDEKKMGKRIAKDKKQNKLTYPSVLGVDESRNLVEKLFAESEGILAGLPYDTELLKFLSEKIYRRVF